MPHPSDRFDSPTSACEDTITQQKPAPLTVEELEEARRDKHYSTSGNARWLATIDSRDAKIAELNATVAAFLKKYDALEPAMNNAFALAAIHGQGHKGETWAAELTALRTATQGKE